MKKIFAIILALTLLASLSVTILAENTSGGQADITTSIDPTYTVTIPADVTVQFNATKTSFGSIEVEAAQIHPDKCIVVSISTDGKLENSIDNAKVIPYAIKDGSDNDFTRASYLTEGDCTELFIHISTEDWNAAYAGDYSDTVTFTVSYENK